MRTFIILLALMAATSSKAQSSLEFCPTLYHNDVYFAGKQGKALAMIHFSLEGASTITIDERKYTIGKITAHYVENNDSIVSLSYHYYRPDRDKIYYYSGKEEDNETLLLDFGLNVGDDFVFQNGKTAKVVEKEDSFGRFKLRKLTLEGVSDTSFHDVWLEGMGSMTYGLLPPSFTEDVVDIVPYWKDYYGGSSSSDYQFVNNDLVKTSLVFPKQVLGMSDIRPWTCEFIGDSLRIMGSKQQFLQDRNVFFAYVNGSDVYIDHMVLFGYIGSETNKLIDVKLGNFEPGTYNIHYSTFNWVPVNWDYSNLQEVFGQCFIDTTIVCKGNTTTTYHPFAEEGKVWNYHHGSMMPQYEYDYTYEIRGQEYVGDGLPCKKMFKDGQFYASIYENDSQVYYYDSHNGALVLLYDFDCKAGDEIVANSQSVHILKTGEKDYLGTKRKVIWWLPTDEYQETVRNIPEEEIDNWISEGCERDEFGQWIEGIGSNLDLFACTPMPGNNDYLTTCYVGDVKLYEAEWLTGTDPETPNDTIVNNPQAEVGDTLMVDVGNGVMMTFCVTSVIDKTVQVGTGVAPYSAIPVKTTGSVTIPEEVNGYRVTALAYGAFYNCANLVAVSLPESVNYIGAYTFWNCGSLREIRISSLEGWCAMHMDMAPPFSNGCQLVIDGTPLVDKVVFPNSIKTIPNRAFDHYTCIKEIELPAQLETIGKYAFSSTNLRELVLPEHVQSVGLGAFSSNEQMERLVLPASLKEFGDFAFAWNFSLKSIYSFITDPSPIPSNVFTLELGEANYEDLEYSHFSRATLYVPKGTKQLYEAKPGWNRFERIKEFNPSAFDIDSIGYLPFAEEGKVWNYRHGSMMPQYEYDYTYEIRGQEYVGDGLPCKKMFKDGQPYASIYENDSQVYYYDSQNGALVLLYDFDCKAGDELVANSESVHILKTGEKDYLGTKRKVIWWLPSDEYQEMVRSVPEEDLENCISERCERGEFGQWIEGIGSNLDLFACVPMPGNNNYLRSCYVGDVKLYEDEWFAGIEFVQAEPLRSKQTISLYDLTGRRLTTEPKQGMYLRNGKKVMKVKN